MHTLWLTHVTFNFRLEIDRLSPHLYYPYNMIHYRVRTSSNATDAVVRVLIKDQRRAAETRHGQIPIASP